MDLGKKIRVLEIEVEPALPAGPTVPEKVPQQEPVTVE